MNPTTPPPPPPPATLSARLAAWLVERYPDEFRRAHGAELRDASAWTLAASPTPLDTARLLANLAAGAAHQHASEFIRDLRYATRTLRRSKWFAACAVFSLAIGAGTVLPIYLTFASTLFRNVESIAAPESVVAAMQPVSHPHYVALRDAPDSPFAGLTAFMPRLPAVLRANPAAETGERIWGQMVAPNYFAVLGVRMHRGRPFDSSPGPVTAAATASATPPATPAVISHSLWQRRFGEQPGVIGRAILLNGHAAIVTGIAPPRFAGTSPVTGAADFWVPDTAAGFTAQPAAASRVASFQLAGRLRPGLSRRQAEAALDALYRHIDPPAGEAARSNTAHRLLLMPGARVFAVPDSVLPMMIGFPSAIALLTLWIACTNVGALMLARAAARRREVAVRAALGAGRGRLIRQLIAESLLLSVAGTAIGLAVTILSLRYSDSLNGLLPAYARLEFSAGWETCLAAAGVALATTAFCGLAPAWQVSRVGVSAALKDAASEALPRFGWFSTRNHLLLQQIAASLCLLLLSGFVTLGLSRRSQIDLGFDTARLATVSVDPLRDGVPPGRAADLLAGLPRAVAEDPALESAALAESSPASIAMPEFARASPFGNDKIRERTGVLRVGDGYLESLGIPIVSGRGLDGADHRAGTRAALINESLARKLWPDANPVGQTLDLRFGERIEPRQVAGVAKDVRNNVFAGFRATPAVYLPLDPSRLETMPDAGWTLIVRGRPGSSPLDAARAAILARHPDLTVFNPVTVDETAARFLAMLRMTLVTYGGLGLFGLLLSAVGLAGVTAYAVALRTREIGIRMALGATGGQVIRLVLREGMGLLLGGALLGLGFVALLSRLLRGYLTEFGKLSELTLTDPALLGGALALLAAMSLAACYFPARRATRVNPVAALRE